MIPLIWCAAFLFIFFVCVVANLPAKDSPGVQQGAIDRVDNSGSCSDRGGLMELEQILKQKTFTR